MTTATINNKTYRTDCPVQTTNDKPCDECNMCPPVDPEWMLAVYDALESTNS